jgi:ankyrin repeat protein
MNACAESSTPRRIPRAETCAASAALVRKLLARGLDPNRPDWLGKTFLHACAARGDRSVAAVLLDAGADINARGLEFNEMPLAAAVRSGLGNKEPKLA